MQRKKQRKNLIKEAVGMVTKICPGKHGNFALVHAETVMGVVSFHCEKPVWPYKELPEKGRDVYMKDFRKAPKGWQAHTVNYLRPEVEA